MAFRQLDRIGGKPQMDLVGGERVFSIADTTQIVFLAGKADTFQDWVRLGRYIYRATKAQENRKPQYRMQ